MTDDEFLRRSADPKVPRHDDHHDNNTDNVEDIHRFSFHRDGGIEVKSVSAKFASVPKPGAMSEVFCVPVTAFGRELLFLKSREAIRVHLSVVDRAAFLALTYRAEIGVRTDQGVITAAFAYVLRR